MADPRSLGGREWDRLGSEFPPLLTVSVAMKRKGGRGEGEERKREEWNRSKCEVVF